jgi:anion-transporting  ArsA/GET3 family ATPase
MTASSKRVVFTMGGKGGVGKTGFVVALAEWFAANNISVWHFVWTRVDSL